MLTPAPQNQSTPNWVWLSFIPIFGSLAIVYAGHKSRTSNWMYLGIGTFVAALTTASTSYSVVIWIFQAVVSLYFKTEFLNKMAALLDSPGFHNLSSHQFIPSVKGKIDINNCSKDQLVRGLGLPIIYANDIESLQNEGFVFTHLEELSEIAGLPESYVRKMQGLLVFSYEYRRDIDASWRQANVCSTQDLITLGISLEFANRIIEERDAKGEYKSVMDIKRRTKVPFKSFQRIM
jgi:DNA uptake protein ComE-like DNA-binding protein